MTKKDNNSPSQLPQWPDLLEALPPPSIPLQNTQHSTHNQSHTKPTERSGELLNSLCVIDVLECPNVGNIPLQTWERHQAKKLFQLNRKRATHLHAPPSTTLEIDSHSVRQGGDALRHAVCQLLNTLIPTDDDGTRHADTIALQRLSGAMTNLMFVVCVHEHPLSLSTAKHPEQNPIIFKALMRIYGQGTDKFFSRERELYFLQVLSSMKVGPRLLGMFGNGRFEEFLDADTLTNNDVRQLDISRNTAHKLYEIHSVVGIVAEEIHENAAEIVEKKRLGTVPEYHSELWTRIFDWHQKALDVMPQLLSDSKDEKYHDRLKKLNIQSWVDTIKWLQKRCEALRSPVVFCHNDSQYGNIMKSHADGEILIIDYEYACYNNRGFDIANHFCEWAADYHGPTPHLLDFSKYPSEQDQVEFLTAYLDARDAFVASTNHGQRRRRFSAASLTSNSSDMSAGAASSLSPPQPSRSSDNLNSLERPHQRTQSHISDYRMTLSALMLGPSPRLSPTLSPMLTPHHLTMLRIQELQRIRSEVNLFVLASHVMWGMWGLVQASQSVIDFDYIGYSLCRFDEFARWKKQVLHLN